MDVELRHLRCLIAIVDSGGFTDAALDLGISQPAVSRTLAALEDVLGVRLLRRTSREVVLTAAGVRVLARARRVVAEVEDLAREAKTGRGRLRIGHAWAAIGEHTLEFQRRWTERHPDVSLHLVRTNSPTGGLAEGACDLAVVRTPSDTVWPDTAAGRFDAKRFDRAVVGLESRYCALAADDPMARRRQLRLDDLSDRTLAVDPRTGTTTPELWPVGSRPRVEEIHDVDDWLAVIGTGRCVGVTAESTLTQYRRPGIVFRRVRDAPPIPVWLIWWRDDPHPATQDVVGLMAELYRDNTTPTRRGAGRAAPPEGQPGQPETR
ncbi:LysR family transcriptional regulator [Saccharothrix sp. ALI-22-I]|uniref:LysR family transcriptional regulator n=1 Tax=Saccharothrix sp. ALI-22-I TaxID=1933778 RepID=UPI00097C4B76|nr:LysR family transcriptional regulator [Saccharothrix sp. ALI-22-I]ONI80359.1 LysR family transcriptional regulator [Saccharothrix sp. ALI-22-I]